jgi:HEAT repeat protein
VSALEDDDTGVQWIAAQGLASLGREGVKPLLSALIVRSDSPRLLTGAHHVLRLIADDRLREKLAPVVTAIEDVEPVLEVPVAAHQALVVLQG